MKLICLILLLFSCSKEIKKGTSISQYVDNLIYGDPIRIEISKNSKLSMEISSDTLYQQNNGHTILYGSVYVDLFNDDGVKTSELHSDTAIVYMNSDSLKAIGDVFIRSTKGLKLFSDEIILFNDKKLVKSEKDVIFTSNNSDTLYGTGFWSNFDMTKSQIVKPKGTISQKK